jgi:glycosyltransferase involved in cell wall biosynthesis
VLVSPADAGALAGALADLLGAPSRRRAMGRAALEKARRSFGLETQARRTLDLWRRLLEEQAA